MYHGYTGCPDTFDRISKYLTDQGFMTLTPLLPGQGLQKHFGCSVPGICTWDKFNPSEIPTDKDEYIQWSKDVVDMVNEQIYLLPAASKAPNFAVHAMGLSAGAAMAPFAAQLPNSPFQKVIAVNPLWAITVRDLDFSAFDCKFQEDPKSCIMGALGIFFGFPGLGSIQDPAPSIQEDMGPFAAIVKTLHEMDDRLQKFALKQTIGRIFSLPYDSFFLALWEAFAFIGDTATLRGLSIFNKDYGWGPMCAAQYKNGRGGICTFRIKNLLGLHSFTEYVLGNLHQIPKSVQYHSIHSDLDAGTSDSINKAVVNALKGSRCSYKIGCAYDKLKDAAGTNNCGAPHSVFSGKEQLIVQPFEMYWETDLFKNIGSILNGQMKEIGSLIEGYDKSICVSTTEKTIGWGSLFDNLGAKYLANAQKRYRE
jgi:hypothetical protein